MNIKQFTINLISQVDKGAYSNIILNESFQKSSYQNKEKKFITEIFYGVLRNKKYIDYIIKKNTKEIKKEWLRNLLRISLYQITYMNSDDAGVVWEAAELTKKKYGVPVGKFVNAFLRRYLREKEAEINFLKENNKLDILYSIPKWFCEILEKQYGKENLESAIKSMKKIPYLSMRVNRLKYSEEEFEKLLADKKIEIIKKVDTVYYLSSGEVINFPEFKEGKIIAQDASSYLAGKILEPQKNSLVLDICSAPGGKTAVLAELMQNEGEIIALDIHNHKIKLIDSNMKKLGVNIVKSIVLDARSVNKQGRKFDKILVDVPCSGYGVVRKKPEILYNKKQENIEEISKIQLEILNSAGDILKSRGELVYSTCTIVNQENTDNIRKFLEMRDDFETVEINIPSNVNGTFDEFGGFKIDYTEEIMDGFYIIKLRKK